MNLPENQEQMEQLVIRYLYSDMDDQEIQEFNQALKNNSALRAVFEREQHLNQSVPAGTAPYIDDDRIEENRRKLHRNLQRQVANQSTLGNFFLGMLRKPSLVAFQSIALVSSYILGFIIASPGEVATQPGNPMAGIVSPLSLVGEQDYEIADMHIDRFDPVSGDIDLSFSIASETRLQGNVSDTGVRTLMTVALLNEIDAAARLDAIEALQNARYDEDVSASMIHVLNTDNNPGVRYSAVRSLVDFVEDEPVRDALRNALSNDVNPGVRLEAFDALASNPDEETLAVFRRLTTLETNSYIRDRAREIVEGNDNANAAPAIF